MECNRDEALRAKEIAEKKFTAKDIAGAKKFALKAQNLYPSLEGISQMIATLEVYLASEIVVGGEKDWYAILRVNASADEEAVKKQYRKLALQLHPDKNKSVGAEGAFKLISEAWSVLSDKSRRILYDQKRHVRGFQQRASQPKQDRPVPSTTNGFYNCANNEASSSRVRKSATTCPPPASSVPPSFRYRNPNTFWTSCSGCRMQYEYLRRYLNQNLLCPKCNKPFLATETVIPANGPDPSIQWLNSLRQQQQQNSNPNPTTKSMYGPGNTDSYNNLNSQWHTFSRAAGTASANASSTAAAQASNMVHPKKEKKRKEHEETQTAREETIKRRNATKRNSRNLNADFSGNVSAKKRRGSKDDAETGYGGDGTDQMAASMGNTGMGSGAAFNSFTSNKSFNSNIAASEMNRANGVSVDSYKTRWIARQAYLSREFSQLHIRNILLEKARLSIHKKLENWKAADAAKSLVKEKAKKRQRQKENDEEALEEEKAKKKQKQQENDKEEARNAVNESAANHIMVDETGKDTKHASHEESNDHTADPEKETFEPVDFQVPDPDFHDFDSDRSEKSFQDEQIWATYDDEDGMPRFYVLVQKVISLKPFKVRMSFLTSKSNSEFGALNWVGSGFAKTCGNFRISRYETKDAINIFSHKVRWEKCARGVIRIIPRKGDVWALYRNWSPDWDEHTPDDVIYKYDMVEVLEDYTEEKGVPVSPLVKVAGFKTVFHRHPDEKVVNMIPNEEMFRFSHQVPAILLTGEEGHNAPKGCHELDPAATPLELLQVITEAKEDEVTRDAEQQQA